MIGVVIGDGIRQGQAINGMQLKNVLFISNGNIVNAL